MTETDYIEVTTKEQSVRLYIVPGVGEDTSFECQTRKEISKIDWHILLDLPGYKPGSANALASTSRNKYYMIIPFMKYVGSETHLCCFRQKRNRYDRHYFLNINDDPLPV